MAENANNYKKKGNVKWIAALFLVFFLGGLGLYTLVCRNIGTGEMWRYSLCYCVYISSEIKNVPLIGLQESPVYRASGIDFNHSETNNFNAVSYQSKSSAEEIISETKKYFNGLNFTDGNMKCGNHRKCLNCCAEFKRGNMTVSLIVFMNEDIESKSSDTNRVNIRVDIFQ